MNRKNAPKTHKTGAISFVSPEKIPLNESVPLYWMSDIANETSRIDIYFDAGLRKGKNSIASTTSSLLLSGTSLKSSTEIHNQLNDLGAFFDIGLSHEGVMVSLFALKRNILEAYEVLLDAIINARFPESEFQEVKAEKIQKFKINMNRVGVLAQRAFQKQLYYGTKYAEVSNEIDLQKVERKELLKFHEENYICGLFKIAVVGALAEGQIQHIINISKRLCIKNPLEFKSDFCNKPGAIHIEKNDAVQTAIRIGKTLFNKTNKDCNEKDPNDFCKYDNTSIKSLPGEITNTFRGAMRLLYRENGELKTKNSSYLYTYEQEHCFSKQPKKMYKNYTPQKSWCSNSKTTNGESKVEFKEDEAIFGIEYISNDDCKIACDMINAYENNLNKLSGGKSILGQDQKKC